MIERDSIELYSTEYVGLAFDFQVNPASCGNNEHYEQYISLMAISDQSEGLGTTHVFLREDDKGKHILGYITLRASSYVRKYGAEYQGSPALEVFELAVDQRYEKRGIGSILMEFALATAQDLRTNHLGIQYILVCADAQAVPFYKKLGFARVDEYGEIPRENWNVHCIPMFLKLPDE